MKKIKRVLILLLLLFLIGISIFYSPYRPLLPGYHKLYYTSEKYQRLKENIEKSRVEICKQYKESKTAAVKDEILKKAKLKFVEIVKGNTFPYWYGTFWTFNGHSQIPGESSIACGYFVSTVLKDAGCKINRTRLAQAPSEEND